MNLRFLKSFCLVAEVGSLAGAARRLGLAHATVTEQIRAVEAELGATLLVRRGQGVALTAAGSALLSQARQVVTQIDAMRHLAQGGRPSGHLRVGAISTALTALLPPALQQLPHRFPEVDLTVVPGTSVGLFRMLEAGEIDCALLVRPPFSIPKSMTWRPVRDEPLVLVAPASLSGETLEDLFAAAPLIRMDRAAWTGRIVEQFVAERGLAFRELFELDAPEVIVVLVAQGLGLSLLPDWGITAPAGRNVRIVPVDDVRYARPVGILGRRGPAATLVEAFAGTVMAGLSMGRPPP